MANQYREKPVVIEAFQMTEERRQDNAEWPNWLHQAWQKEREEVGSVGASAFPNSDGTDRLVIHTLEGYMLVGWGDYIIQDIKGEIYPCKPDIFEASYEPVTDTQ